MDGAMQVSNRSPVAEITDLFECGFQWVFDLFEFGFQWISGSVRIRFLVDFQVCSNTAFGGFPDLFEISLKNEANFKSLQIQFVMDYWVWSNTDFRLCSSVVFNGATRGVTVSTPAFLACHWCYCARSSLAWGLNLRTVVCGIFWSSSPGVFSEYSGFLPSFIGIMV